MCIKERLVCVALACKKWMFGTNAALVCLQLRAHYAQYLKRSGSLKKLLLHLFKLMPENPAYPGQGSETKDGKTFFTESLTLHVDSE